MASINTKDLNRIFEKLDLNGDGLISLYDLKHILHNIGVETSLDELELLAGKTNLALGDFVLLYDTISGQKNEDKICREDSIEEDEPVESDLVKAFKVYDLNGDGYVSSEELQSVLSRLGLWSEGCGKNGERMINEYDTNCDGVLDFDEFKNMMLN